MSSIAFEIYRELREKELENYIRHTYRKSYNLSNRKKNVVIYTNEDVDLTETINNVDLMVDNQPIDRRLKYRLDDISKEQRLSTESYLVYDLLFQPCGQDFDNLEKEESAEKMKRLAYDIFVWIRRMFGSENVLGMSIHNDEPQAHLHVAIVPMTEEGYIDPEAVIKGEFHIKSMRNDLIAYLNESGWHFKLDNNQEIESF